MTTPVLALSDTLSGVVLGGAIGLVGSLIATFAAWKGGRADREHQAELAREAWDRDRWRETYIDLVVYIRRWEQLARRRGLGMGEHTDPLPEWTSDEELWVLQARVEAFASTAVKEAMHEWFEAQLATRLQLENIVMTSRRVGGPSPDFQAAHEASVRLSAASDMVAECVVADLRRKRKPA